MPEITQLVRVALRYGRGDPVIIGETLITGPALDTDVETLAGDQGAWLTVHDAQDREVFRRVLPDPDTANERLTAQDGMDRSDLGLARVCVVELPWPGEGSSVRVRVRRAEDRGLEGTVVDLPLSPSAAGLEPPGAPTQVHAGWGEHNPGALTVLFLPDGFTEAELPAFRDVVERTIDRFGRTEPFASLRDHLRFARVDLPSRDSGIEGERPRDTAFGGHFQPGSLDRVILADQDRASAALNAYARTSAAALIVANTPKYGGSGGAAAVFSCEPSWAPEIALHELGHSRFGLADEYDAAGQASTAEPVEPNVCAHGDRARLKWAAAVPAQVPLPTWRFGEPPPSTEELGAYEGGKYRSRGVFRPAWDCKMRTPGKPFCAVCEAEIRRRLARHAPA